MRALVLLCALAGAARGAEDPLADLERQQQKLFERVGPAVVFISTGEAFGSGFFVTREGLILTNAHVVGNQPWVQVVTASGAKFNGRVLRKAGDDIDLALVQIDDENTPALPLVWKSDLRVGSWVGSVGHGRGGIWSFNTGMVSNIYPSGSDRPVFQTQIPLNPGNSGGPVFDRRGRVVGVVTAAMTNSQNMNFAIRTEVALSAFAELAGACDCLAISAPAGVPVFVDGKMAGTGPRVVIAAEARVYEIFAVIKGAMKKLKLRYPDQRIADLR